MATCKRCNGKGTIKCPICKGQGRIIPIFGSSYPCKHCGGSGEVTCPECQGKGTV